MNDQPQQQSGKSTWRKLPFRFSLRSLLWVFLIFGLFLVWREDRNRLENRIQQLEQQRFGYYSTGYGADQLIGPPSVVGMGDSAKAWCPATADGQVEWIELEYPKRMLATGIRVHENYHPGAVSKVLVFNFWGRESVAWTPSDSPAKNLPKCGSRITFNKPVKTRRVKLIIDSPAVPGWNEIDAVGLEADKNTVQWASRATSSSSYGNAPTRSR